MYSSQLYRNNQDNDFGKILERIECSWWCWVQEDGDDLEVMSRSASQFGFTVSDRAPSIL